jgi:hypothetical protein
VFEAHPDIPEEQQRKNVPKLVADTTDRFGTLDLSHKFWNSHRESALEGNMFFFLLSLLERLGFITGRDTWPSGS